MTATATIDITKFMDTPSKTEGSKSNASNSNNDFENVFNSVNKSYQSDRSNSNMNAHEHTHTTAAKSDDTHRSDKKDSADSDKTNSNTRANDDKDSNNNVKSEKDNQNTTNTESYTKEADAKDSTSKTNEEAVAKDVDTELEKTVESDSSETVKNVLESINAEIVENATNTDKVDNSKLAAVPNENEISNQQTSANEIGVKVDEQTDKEENTTVQNQIVDNTKISTDSTKTIIDILNEGIQQNTAIPADNIVKPEKETNNDNKTQKAADNTDEINNATIIANNIIDASAMMLNLQSQAPAVTQNTQDSINIAINSEINTQVKIGAQQNVVDTKQQAATIKSNNSVSPDETQQTPQIELGQVDLNNKTNMSVATTEQQIANLKIDSDDKQANNTDGSNTLNFAQNKAETQILVADTNVKTDNTQNKNTSKDLMDKISETQDLMDKTNANISSLSTSSSSTSKDSNNLLNKQDTQDQVVKLSLETKDKQTDSNLNVSTLMESNNQTTIDKASAGMQTHETKELSKADIFSQINSQLNRLTEDDSKTTKVNIILRPENLGKISLELVNSKDGMTAKMTTDNAQVKELLDKNLNGLKDNLGSQGIHVNNVSVKVETTQKQDNMFSFDGHNANGNQQQSNNNHAHNSNTSFDEEIDKIAGGINTETETETEDSISVATHNGQIDYKI